MNQKLLNMINIIIEKKKNKMIPEINSMTSFRNDIGFDSLDLAELTVRIESEFGIDIFLDGLVNTVGEVEKKLENTEIL